MTSPATPTPPAAQDIAWTAGLGFSAIAYYAGTRHEAAGRAAPGLAHSPSASL
jgi:hypothetical protein